MRNRILVSTTLVLAGCSAASAHASDLIECVSIDGKQQVSLKVKFGDGGDSGTIERVDIPTADVLLTTDTVDGEPGLLLADPRVSWDEISVSLEDPRNVHIIADISLSRAIALMAPDDPEREDYWEAVGGTFALDGRGAWVVSCTGWAWR